MNPADIGNAYNHITHLWQSEKFNLENGMAAHKRALTFVKSRGRALDIGCGCTGRFISLFQQEGFTPEGVDISDEMIQLARQKHPDVTFHHQDICQWKPPSKYDFITAWDSIWHIPLAQQKSVITKLIDSLSANGVLIFSFGGTDKPGEHTDSFMGPKVYYSSLGTNGFLSLLIELGTVCRHMEYDQHPELHAYLIAQKTLP
ncbi:class I SAM-dependent methyltransferase [Halomonas citrativorans]|uniref:Class I SAM-dependent methyltransferase n=1 Tax=Halomonas citrativorans TaxID=2742612 RepID=A0ABR9FF10_9GAMM|nr:class I SAM-dependent methyltransferase [Halomonas citrativorans]MBE0404614.1 class I SAM-dependent methyltransferase [Halomonas citrativorans]